MKIIDCKQGTEEWHKARIGLPTASNFFRILTPTGKPSTQWETYAHEILAEEIIGRAIEGYVSKDMEEGIRREEESVNYYEMTNSIDTVKVGFMREEVPLMGASPDRLVGNDGLLEMKNPKHNTHVSYLLDPSELAKEYWTQTQGQLLVSGRRWVDIMSYYPDPKMPKVCCRIERNEPYIQALRMAMADFNAKLDRKRQQLIKDGHLIENKDPAHALRAG